LAEEVKEGYVNNENKMHYSAKYLQDMMQEFAEIVNDGGEE